MQAAKLPAWCKIRYNLSDSGLLWLQEKMCLSLTCQAIFTDYNALQTFSADVLCRRSLQTFSAVLHISALEKVVVIHRSSTLTLSTFS